MNQVHTTWSSHTITCILYLPLHIVKSVLQATFCPLCVLWQLLAATVIHTNTLFPKPMYYETYYQLFVLVLNAGHVCDTCTCYNLSTYLGKLKINVSPHRSLKGTSSARKPCPCQVNTLKQST